MRSARRELVNSIRSRFGIPRRLRAGLLAVGLLASGCAGSPGSFPGLSRSGDAGREIRPEAPPEYDVLVAQQHQVDGSGQAAVAAYRRALAKDADSSYLHLALADALARSQHMDEAIAHARLALDLDPERREARTLIAQLHRIRGEPQLAEASLVTPEGAPLDLEAAYQLYHLYLETGRAEAAVEVARWMRDEDPEEVRGYVMLASALERAGRSLEAEAVLEEALLIEPENLRLRTMLARSKRLRGDREGEIRVYEETLTDFPDDRETLESLADAQISEGDYEGAIWTLARIEERFPEDLSSALRLAFLFFDTGSYDEAVDRFARIVSERPGEHEIIFYYANALARSKRSEEALAAFLQIPPSYEHFPDARIQVAAIYENSGNYEQATRVIEEVLVYRPERRLQLYAATLRVHAGDFEGAVAYLEDLLVQNPQDDELLYGLGVIHGENGQAEEAIRYMQRAVASNPDNASALNFIGYTWAERGENLDEAEALIVRAIALRPEDGYIVDSLAWVYYMRAHALIESGEQTERADAYLKRSLEELSRAEEMTGGDPVIAEHLGDTLLLMGERRRALEEFEKGVELGVREHEQPEFHEKLDALRREFH